MIKKKYKQKQQDTLDIRQKIQDISLRRIKEKRIIKRNTAFLEKKRIIRQTSHNKQTYSK